MSAKLVLAVACVALVCAMIEAGGHGGHHKKVIIHVPLFVKHHHHKHTIVKHIHHKEKGGDDDDHYEVLGYTYGEPKSAHGGHGWHAADEGHAGDESPVSFEGSDHGSYGLTGSEDHSSYGVSSSGGDYGSDGGHGGY